MRSWKFNHGRPIHDTYAYKEQNLCLHGTDTYAYMPQQKGNSATKEGRAKSFPPSLSGKAEERLGMAVGIILPNVRIYEDIGRKGVDQQ